MGESRGKPARIAGRRRWYTLSGMKPGNVGLGVGLRRAATVAIMLAGVLLANRDVIFLRSSVMSMAGMAVAEPSPFPVTISVPDSSYVIYPDEIDLSYVWTDGGFAATFSEDRLRMELASLAAIVNRRPVEPLLNLNDLSVAPGALGVELDVDETIASIRAIIGRAAYDEMAPAVLSTIPQAHSPEAIGGFAEKPVGEFTTNFPKLQFNRNYNIGLCASFFNGIVLLPGEELSFNSTTGDRTYGTGYKSAPVIENQELVPGVGGGTCQVSTTLYNAACLEAGMAVVERWPHGLGVHYIHNNRDATVAYPGRDLKFINTYSEAVLITSQVTADSITFRVFTKPGAHNLISPLQVEMTERQKSKTSPPKPRPKPKPEEAKKPSEPAVEDKDKAPAPPQETNPGETPPDGGENPPDEVKPPPEEQTPPPAEEDAPPPDKEEGE